MSLPPAPREETKTSAPTTAIAIDDAAAAAAATDEKLKTSGAALPLPPAEYTVVLAVGGSVNERIVFARLGPLRTAVELKRVKEMMRAYAPERAYLRYDSFDWNWRRPDSGQSSSSSASPAGGLRCTLEGRAARECVLRFREALLGAEAAADATAPQLFTVANYRELQRDMLRGGDKRHACEDVVGWLLLESGQRSVPTGGSGSGTENNNDDGAAERTVHEVPWNRSTTTDYELPTLPAAADETTRAAQTAAAAWGWVCATCRYRLPHATRRRGDGYCLLCEPPDY